MVLEFELRGKNRIDDGEMNHIGKFTVKHFIDKELQIKILVHVGSIQSIVLSLFGKEI